MKAVVTHGVREISIDEVPIPIPANDEVIVKVLATGICGGDIRMYKGTFPYLNYPIINGHEFCGMVEEKGGLVENVAVGDYVTAEPIIPCGHCYACSIGKINCCSALKVLGVHVDGCFAEYICVKADRIYKLPIKISPEDACMVEPYGIAMHALQRLQITSEDSLLILGAGPIGLSALDIARGFGIRTMVSDNYPTRLMIANKLGAEGVVNPNELDIKKEVDRFTHGWGFPTILEATGVPAAIQTTQDSVANGGRICVAGVTNENIELSVMTFCNKEVSIFGTRNSVGVFPSIIELIENKRLHPELLRTHVFSMENFGDAIKTAVDNAPNTCKVVVKME